MGTEVELVDFELKDNPKYPGDKDIKIQFAYADEQGKEKKSTKELNLPMSILNTYYAFLKNVKDEMKQDSLIADKKSISFASVSLEVTPKLRTFMLRRDRIDEYNLFKFLHSISIFSCAEPQWLSDNAFKNSLSLLISFMENMQTIKLPESTSDEENEACLTNFNALWGRKPLIQKISVSSNDDEIKSASSGMSPILSTPANPLPIGQVEQQVIVHAANTIEDDLEEEQPWNDIEAPATNLNKVAVACAVTVTALAYRSITSKVTPALVFSAANQLDGLVQQVVRTASRVPYLPSFVGAVASKVARVANVLSGNNR